MGANFIVWYDSASHKARRYFHSVDLTQEKSVIWVTDKNEAAQFSTPETGELVRKGLSRRWHYWRAKVTGLDEKLPEPNFVEEGEVQEIEGSHD